MAGRAERLGESRHCGVANAAGNVTRIQNIAANSDHVDDHARTPRLHAAEIFTAEIDVVENLRVPTRTPSLFIDSLQRTRGDVARVVDENIDISTRSHYPSGGAVLREIDGDRVHLYGMPAPDVLRGIFERRLRAGGEMQMAALGSKTPRHCQAQTF